MSKQPNVSTFEGFSGYAKCLHLVQVLGRQL